MPIVVSCKAGGPGTGRINLVYKWFGFFVTKIVLKYKLISLKMTESLKILFGLTNTLNEG